MKIFRLMLITSLIFSTNVNNVYASDIEYLIESQPAPFTGYLLSIPKTMQIKKSLEDCDRIYFLNKSLEQSIEIYKKNETLYVNQLDVLKKQNSELDKAVQSQRHTEFWETVMYFGIGVLTTSAIVYATQR